MEEFEKKEINEYQKKKFEEFEQGSVVKFFEKYGDVLEKTAQKKEIKVLDIGGGSSNFALALSRYFQECGANANIFVLDITRYPTWEQYGEKIHFVEGSAFDVEKFFEQQSFDLIFVNYTFHHLVQKSWQKTVAGFESLLTMIHKMLKEDGVLCVAECYYEILFMKGFSMNLSFGRYTV